MSHYLIRSAAVHDAASIAHHRVAMFREMGQVPTESVATELQKVSAVEIAAALRDGSYIGWLAVTDRDQIIGGAGVHIKPQLPRLSPDGTRVVTGTVPLVVNVYTEPAWRRQGVARTVMRTLMQWARERGFDRVLLHASAAGRPLYVSLGFVPTNEMRWTPVDL